MPMGTPFSSTRTPLRHIAEERLRDGTPPPQDAWIPGMDALTVLHNLAGSPESAADALKILHELSVHQVELAMQQEELEHSRTELTASLEVYVERFDFAPVGYFVVEPDGTIVEGNRAGAELVKVDRNDLPGRSIESIVAPDSQPLLRALLNRSRPDQPCEACEVVLVAGDSAVQGGSPASGGNPAVGGSPAAGGSARRYVVAAAAAPNTRFLNVTFSPLADGVGREQQT